MAFKDEEEKMSKIQKYCFKCGKTVFVKIIGKDMYCPKCGEYLGKYEPPKFR